MAEEGFVEMCELRLVKGLDKSLFHSRAVASKKGIDIG
jgi:hypothetical protein